MGTKTSYLTRQPSVNRYFLAAVYPKRGHRIAADVVSLCCSFACPSLCNHLCSQGWEFVENDGDDVGEDGGVDA